ncbi:unnamed protein product [Acanthoscelides obtectus]|uniref:Uncharacterized protein n=1 Tax=Acanthoscelides obtectus TaxID=200917 RepID=A0A9P0LK65_ACAOB|nr:unnamed protein product [Acanthoscelides obtectus]CAK1675523.1 hypothetical protein AOBTE_LOCUS30276 [Acanthoscelides obtectus]
MTHRGTKSACGINRILGNTVDRQQEATLGNK